jgi:hypothetical protein
MQGGKRPGAGRKKGSINKFTGIARDNVAQVFEQIGGIDRMAQWAEDNPTEFYKHYARLIPLEVTGKDGNDLTLRLKIDAVPNSDGN